MPNIDEPPKQVTLNDELFAEFCQHLSSSLNVVDFLQKNNQLKDPSFDPMADDPFVLAVLDPKLMERLIELRYPDLVLSCIRSFRVPASCADVFLSEFEKNMCDLFFNCIEKLGQTVKIEVRDNQLVVHCPAILSDLILPPIGRMHHEIIRSLDYFIKMVDAVGGKAEKLFLNAKAPTSESQFVQIWVSEHLGMGPPPSGGIIAVV